MDGALGYVHYTPLTLHSLQFRRPGLEDPLEKEMATSPGHFPRDGEAAYQAPPSVGCSRQEYWSGVPLPYPYITSGNAS